MLKSATSPLLAKLEAMGRHDAQAGRPARWGQIHAALLNAIGSRDDFSQDFAVHLYSFYRKGYSSAVAGRVPALISGRCFA